MSQRTQDDRFPALQAFVCDTYATLHAQARVRELTETEASILHNCAFVLQPFSENEFKQALGVEQ